MAEITLIRHGQASLGKANYDQLSDVGCQQAFLLGKHWRSLGITFDAIVMGSMRRHEQTTQQFLKGFCDQENVSMSDHPITIDAGLNEYNHTFLLSVLQHSFPKDWIDTGHLQRDYYHNIRQALSYWAEGKIVTDGQDSWEAFQTRVQTALLKSMEQPFKRLLLITSGGPIGNLLGHCLKLQANEMLNVSLRIKNTSATTIITNRKDFTVETMNDISHLNNKQYKNLITLV